MQNSPAPFNLSADDVTYLRDLGISSAVVTAMMNRDKALVQQPAPYNYNQQLYPPASPPPPAPVATQEPVADTSAVTYATDAPEDVSYFYSDLAPYGSWVNLAGYGWCWQPTTVAVNHDWRPYCDGGHWDYTDAGWFWDSDYSWGWAPFHYGRWFHHERNGWVWFPDRVWGPAWVTWRSAGNDCGWAPLPLGVAFDTAGGFRFHGVRVGMDFDFGLSVDLFTFVGLTDLREHDLPHRRLAPVEMNRVYPRSTIINNYTMENRSVVNHGIPVERVAQATHGPIQTIHIREASAGMARPDARSGATPVVYRREVGPPERTTAMRAQVVDERHPLVQHAPTAPVVPARNSGPGNTGYRSSGPAPVTPARGSGPANVGYRPSGPAPVTPARNSGPANVGYRPPAAAPAAPALNSGPGNAGYRPPAGVQTRPSEKASSPPPQTSVDTGPSAQHGKVPVAKPSNAVHAEPEPFVAGPADVPPPKPVKPAPKPQGPFDYQPRVQKATEAHVLPPLAPKPVQTAPASSGPNTVSHSYTPRIETSTTAHVLPPLPVPPPSHTTTAVPANASAPAHAANPPAASASTPADSHSGGAVASPRDNQQKGR